MLENIEQFSNKSHSIIIFTSLISLLLFGIVLLIRYNKKLKNNNLFLISLNKTYEATLANKDLQLKEVHHRIKNNLQLIVSLLNIEAGNDNETSINDFLIKGQSRIHSISLIHQNLYENEFRNAINLQNYIENIVHNLSQIYNMKIEIEINTNETTLDIDSTIPFGLIITELVCNSFKHAFKDNNSGLLKIDINKNADNKLELILKDNGIGFQEKPDSKLAIGLELVQMMVQQLDGKLHRKFQQGTEYNISF